MAGLDQAIHVLAADKDADARVAQTSLRSLRKLDCGPAHDGANRVKRLGMAGRCSLIRSQGPLAFVESPARDSIHACPIATAPAFGIAKLR
jgi:hypothetical protein